MPKLHYFHDLSISDRDIDTHTLRERIVNAAQLGFKTVATPHQSSTAQLTSADKCDIRTFDSSELQPSKHKFNHSNKEESRNVETVDSLVPYQLKRLNIPVEDASTGQESLSNSSIIDEYDIVVVQPLTDRAFSFACNSMDVDLISVDCSSRLNFRFKTDAVRNALKRGLHFEILYGPMIMARGSRKQFVSNVQALSRECRGHGIVISSGATSSMELRGPLDVINLGTFWGMTEHQARCAISVNPASVVQSAFKRKTFRSCLYLKQLDPKRDSELLVATLNSDTTENRKRARIGGSDIVAVSSILRQEIIDEGSIL